MTAPLLETDQGTDRSTDLYAELFAHEAGHDRFATMPFLEYIKSVEQQEILRPPRNAAELLYNAITSRGVDESHPSGERSYRFFTEGPGAVLGARAATSELVGFLETAKETGNIDKMVVIVAPTGAGKTTLVEKTKRGLVEATKRSPVHAIDGCPVQEDPMNLLAYKVSTEPEKRSAAEERLGVELHGELCPHCEGELRGVDYDATRMQVKPLIFSIAEGRGVQKLEPLGTKDGELGGVLNDILKANRGILELAELGQHDPEFLRALNDLFRGRRIRRNGHEYTLDTLIIGHTTIEEWREFADLKKHPENRSVLERMFVIEMPYHLSTLDEAQVYAKFLDESRVAHHQEAEGDGIHISAQTFEVLSQAAIRTRLHADAGLSQADILQLYNGEEIAGMSKKERQEYLQERRKKGEGMRGVSPNTMKDHVVSLAFAAENGCLDPLQALARLKERVKENNPFLIKSGTESTLDRARIAFEAWLSETVDLAFIEQHRPACEDLFRQYMDAVYVYLEQEEVIDPRTGMDVGPDEKLMVAVEDAMYPDESIGANRERRRQIRTSIATEDAGYVRDDLRMEWTDIPEMEEGILRIVTGSGESTDSLLIYYASLPESERGIRPLENNAPPEMRRIQDAFDVMIREHGFCACCAPKLLYHEARRVVRTQ